MRASARMEVPVHPSRRRGTRSASACNIRAPSRGLRCHACATYRLSSSYYCQQSNGRGTADLRSSARGSIGWMPLVCGDGDGQLRTLRLRLPGTEASLVAVKPKGDEVVVCSVAHHLIRNQDSKSNEGNLFRQKCPRADLVVGIPYCRGNMDLPVIRRHAPCEAVDYPSVPNGILSGSA